MLAPADSGENSHLSWNTVHVPPLLAKAFALHLGKLLT